MSNINNINLECILCENKADYDFQCEHHLCKNCYKIDNFCPICNTKDIKINEIKFPNITIHTDYIYLDSEERRPFARGGLMQLRTY